jgi:hypothetical protein
VSACSRAPIRGPLPLLGSATGSQGSLRRMSHEKVLLTSQSVQWVAHNSTELLEQQLKTKPVLYVSLHTRGEPRWGIAAAHGGELIILVIA